MHATITKSYSSNRVLYSLHFFFSDEYGKTGQPGGEEKHLLPQDTRHFTGEWGRQTTGTDSLNGGAGFTEMEEWHTLP